ncbi:MAG: SulP family inorganic anion transporter [Acidimicrobiales bacterium]
MTDRGRLQAGDVVAGVSVAMIAIPQTLAYAEIAGLPPQHGLYALALPAILAAFFASSPYLQTGPVALTALLAFGALSSLAEPFTSEYVALAALLAFMVGLFRVVLGLVRMGKVAYLLSEPVLTGFTTGAAILIVSSQLPKVFGATTGDRGVLAEAAIALARVDRWSASAIAYATLTVIVVVVGRRMHSLFPGVLLAVALATMISWMTDFDGAVVGAVDASINSIDLSLPWGDAPSLIIGAFAIALVGFAEPSAIARMFAAADRKPWNADREMLSQGVANLTAGLVSGFPIGGSFSRSSLNRVAGAKTRMSGAITGAVVLLAIPLLPLLETLPTAVLGAIVITAVAKLIRIDRLWELIGQSPAQAFVAIGTTVATLALSPRVEIGVLIGIGLAFGVHLYRELAITIEASRVEHTLTVRPQGVLWFGTVPVIGRSIRAELAEHPDIEAVRIDLSGVGRLDYSGAAELARIADELKSVGVTVTTANIPPSAIRSARIHLASYASEATQEETRNV